MPRLIAGFMSVPGSSGPPPAAHTYYLAPSPTGNDSNAGTQASPWATFAKADSMVVAGDVVSILAGTYVEADIVLSTSGLPGLPIVYRSPTRHAAIIQPVDNQAGLEVILGDADYLELDGLQVDGTSYPELLGGITQQGSHTVTRNCWVHHIRGLGATDGASGILTGNGPTAAYDQVDNKVLRCRINDIGDLANPSALTHGIYLSHVNALANNNLIYRIEGGGIHLWHRASDIHVHHNTIFACGNSGIIAGHGTEPEPPTSLNNSKFTNNIIRDCPTGIRSSGAQGTGNEARNNTCFDCPTPTSIAASWTVANTLTTDPGMVNYQIVGTGDYHLVAGNPSVNSGFVTWGPAVDYDNLDRPIGAGFDRGAYEFAGGDAFGLISFGLNNTTRFYSIPDDAVLDLPSGPWAWGMLTRLPSNAGTDYNYLLSCSGLGVTPQWNLACAEAGVADGAAFANHWHFRIGDNAGVDGVLRTSTTAPGGDGVMRLIVVQSTGSSALEMWFCTLAGVATKVVTVPINVGVLTAPNFWNFGRRQDAIDLNYFEGEAGGLFKANVALSATQMQAIAGGSSPVTVLAAGCVAFWPFLNGAGATEVDVVGGIIATRHGSGW